MKIALAIAAVILLMKFSDGPNRPPKEPTTPTKMSFMTMIKKKVN